MIDTHEARTVAPPALSSPIFLTGPSDDSELSELRTRIEAARAAGKEGTGFYVNLFFANEGLRAAIWSLPDFETPFGHTFWEAVTPIVFRMDVGNEGLPLAKRPLMFATRPGRELDDFLALLARANEIGQNYDAPVIRIFDWMPEGLGWGQFVAYLPKAEAAGENGNG